MLPAEGRRRSLGCRSRVRISLGLVCVEGEVVSKALNTPAHAHTVIFVTFGTIPADRREQIGESPGGGSGGKRGGGGLWICDVQSSGGRSGNGTQAYDHTTNQRLFLHRGKFRATPRCTYLC